MTRSIAPLGALVVVLLAAAGTFALAPGAGFGTEPVEQSPEPERTPTPDGSPDSDLRPSDVTPPSPEPANVTTFESADAFAAYLQRAPTRAAYTEDVARAEPASTPGPTSTPMPTGEPTEVAAEATGDAGGSGGAAPPDRHSGTNVQVEGVAEPDLVKTDGQRIYYSPRGGRDRRHDAYDDPGTRVIDASPPGTAEVTAEITHSGRMFLDGDRLVVIGERVWGYDVSNASEPELSWSKSLDGRVHSARMRNGTMYLVLATPVDPESPCPVEPMEDVSAACTEVYHPDRPIPVDVTYTVVALDPADGSVGDELAMVGARDSTVYTSHGGLYVTYTERTSRAEVQMAVLLGPARPLLDDRVAEHLREIREYDLSERATEVEISETLRRWRAGLDEERREEVGEELREAHEEYVEEHRRNLTTTHVVRVNVTGGHATADAGEANATGADATTLSLADTGAVPGRPLNQFSVDEHEGALRIATTVGERWGTESVNDVYVLDASNLSSTGAVTGMGETERIYSVRFVGDRGYVVTYRRIDPFHVLDLSDAADPELEGELKLPGYSSYLHPLSGDRVLGIGEEDGEVKTVIFDVSDPTDPRIGESRVLASEWSAISRSHHAFLLDREHGVFFLPTDHGGMVLSASDLETVHEVNVDRPQRALYIDDYLYVFGEDELAVVDETEWERVETLEL
jgi:uncharacterized secreted protein with C-terminal beta-propeller domain